MILANYLTITVFLVVLFLETSGHITNLADLPVDENGHLKSNWLLYNEGYCATRITGIKNRDVEWAQRELSTISEDVVLELFDSTSGNRCKAACLERGTPKEYIKYPLQRFVYDEATMDLYKWVRSCQSAEVGWVSYLKNLAYVQWIASDGTIHNIAELKRGERNTFWTQTTLGHKFQITDAVTGEVIAKYTTEFSAFYPLGDAGSFVGDIGSIDSEVMHMFRSEWVRSRKVTRTFSELGFKKGRLPNDVWGSLQAYYYNNQRNYVREEYETKGHTVNWHEVDPYMIGMPWGLKGYWQDRGRQLVQDWIGHNVTLENTDIYGMRRYEDGARLLSHVDREATHAASLIINVAQSNIREPWTVEIYDHADRLHEIEMNPGDIVYYESAKALHGRMKPLQGAYYVNLFTHYRPIGDPEWFLKPNPEGTVPPLIDLNGDCYTNEDNTQTCDPPITLPTLSPTGHVVKGPDDLFEFWKNTDPKNNKKSQIQDEL